MRIHTIALSGILLLSLASAAKATSSSTQNHHTVKKPVAAATGKSAHDHISAKSKSSAASAPGKIKTSAASKRTASKTKPASQPASRSHQNTRNPQPSVARVSVSSAHHHHLTAGEKRLARIHELALRNSAPIEPEAIEPHSYLEPAPSHRIETAANTPSPLKGTYDSLVRQNQRSELEGLERIEDEDDLNDRIAAGVLVPVPTSQQLAINGNLPENRRYCRPWTADFLRDLSRAHSTEFAAPLMVTSAVRTVEYQRQLQTVNGNAAAAEGDVASPHLTGGSIDIAKSSMNRKEIAWMRKWLLEMQKTGQIDVEEEFKQSCFHITVYNTYEPLPELKPQPKHRLTRAAAKPTATDNPAPGE
jgi:uncharacterized protein YcbK (DUF882 family)